MFCEHEKVLLKYSMILIFFSMDALENLFPQFVARWFSTKQKTTLKKFNIRARIKWLNYDD